MKTISLVCLTFLFVMHAHGNAVDARGRGISR